MLTYLSIAIIHQAVKDLCACLKSNVNNADCNIYELNAFFRSEYANQLLIASNINLTGDEILKAVYGNVKIKNAR